MLNNKVEFIALFQFFYLIFCCIVESSVNGGAPAIDCTALKNALLNPVMEDNFLCLPNFEAFLVDVKDNSSVSTIPSKLLTRDFVQYLRENRRKRPDKGAVYRPNKGAVFLVPLVLARAGLLWLCW